MKSSKPSPRLVKIAENIKAACKAHPGGARYVWIGAECVTTIKQMQALADFVLSMGKK